MKITLKNLRSSAKSADDLGSRRLQVSSLFAALALASAASAADVVQVRTNFYSVKGETSRELRRSLDLNRPKSQSAPHDAETTWRIEWKSEVEKRNGVCQLSFFDIKTVLTVTLPSWTPTTNAPPELQRQWKAYYTALKLHEVGHVELALGVAAEMRKRVREVSPRANCEEYKRLVTEQARAVLRETERKQKDYDAQTRHGATQGALWRYGRPIRR